MTRNEGIIKAYKAGTRVKDIAAAYGLSRQGLYNVLTAAKVRRRTPPRPYISDDTIRKGSELVRAGATFRGAARALGGISPWSLYRRAKRLGLDPLGDRKHHPWSKQETAVLTRHYKRDKSAEQIAQMIGRTRNEVIGKAFRLAVTR